MHVDRLGSQRPVEFTNERLDLVAAERVVDVDPAQDPHLTRTNERDEQLLH